MSKPKLFIGSSQINLKVAKALKKGLEDCAEVKIWNEDVFGLNEGFLETLLNNRNEYDFAVFVFAPDDVTTSKDETKFSPRDNVLFESGLFMGACGRERVFIVYEETSELKIPSDFAGVTLATYNAARFEDDNASDVEEACHLISNSIEAPKFQHLVGEWCSSYPMTAEEGMPRVEEIVEISARRDGISILSTHNKHNDYYTADGSLSEERQITGKWKSSVDDTDTCGVFMLKVSTNSKYMYGYFTSPDESGAITYASWVLAKMTNADESEIKERLKKAENMLKKLTIGLTPPTQDN
ncbi:MAG TPA: nucleotide-binding protein [Pyrinomonadaceae bacterium]|jgi:hypothetical protein